MDRFFSERETSKILKINRKLFNLFYDNLFKDSWLFDSMRFTTDTTLISYYENTDFYKPHRDSAALTALTWFFEEPKCFEGGVFSFPKYNINIEADNETTIIFPSNILHAVSNIEMKKEYLGKNKGRYCMTQFIINEG